MTFFKQLLFPPLYETLPTDALRTLARVDFTDHPANSVLDLQLPLGGAMDSETLVALMRSFQELGGPTLQVNAVSTEDMLDAQAHPERHRDLVVRICGLSAYFCTLTRAVQDEIIGRQSLAV